MHELSLCRAILDIIHDHVTDKSGKQVKKIGLEIGQLAAVDEAALHFGFDAVRKGTVAHQAILEIVTIPGMALCNLCRTTIAVQHSYDLCPTCGNMSLTITQGEELRVNYLEIG